MGPGPDLLSPSCPFASAGTWPVPVLACAQGELSPLVALSSAKAGQWIQLEGLPQKDSTTVCTKIKLLVGTFDENDFTLRGRLREVNAADTSFAIGSYRIRLGPTAKYGSDRGTLKTFSDLHVGMLLKVKGTYRENGSFCARRVDDESGLLNIKAGIDRKIRLRGPIERVDNSARALTVMGTTFLVTEKSQVRSAMP